MENESEWVTGNVTLSIEGQPLEMQMTVPAKPVTSRKMLPIFQRMSNSFVQIGIDGVNAEGKQISCKAGCGACCRQPVPIAEIEAHEIADLVEKMPKPRRSEIIKRFKDACEHFFKMGWFEKLDSVPAMEHEKRQNVIHEYFAQGIPCPFLEDESCSIYEDRPLACREYLVTTPAENCKKPSKEGINMVPLPVKPSATLCKITKTENLSEAVNFVPLILSLEWAKKFPDNSTKKTGEQWMAEFFTNLTKSEIPEGSIE